MQQRPCLRWKEQTWLYAPEHVEKAVPCLCHTVVVHLQRDQVGILIGDFERWEGRSMCEAQKSRMKMHRLPPLADSNKYHITAPDRHMELIIFLTWRSAHRPLGSTAPPQEGDAASWPASPGPSSSTVVWESSGHMPAATPQTTQPSISQPISLPPRLEKEDLS